MNVNKSRLQRKGFHLFLSLSVMNAERGGDKSL